MTLITAEQMIAALEKAVEERGEGFIYSEGFGGTFDGCQYVAVNEMGDEVAACLAGLALFNLGVPLEVLRQMDVSGALGNSEEINSSEVLGVLAENGFEFEPDAIIAANAAQEDQDSDVSWGVALSSAKVAIR